MEIWKIFACLLSFISLEGRLFCTVLNFIYSFTVYENVGDLENQYI